MLRAPALAPGTARDMAAVLLLNMKAMKALVAEYGEDGAPDEPGAAPLAGGALQDQAASCCGQR